MKSADLAECLIQIGIALSSVHDLESLLEGIVTEARRFTKADAGSLYLVEGDRLRFVVSQNDTLARRGDRQVWRSLVNQTLPISHTSLAGHVALTGEPLNIPDVYRLPEDLGFTFNRAFDEKNGYRTCSMLIVPLKNPQGTILGVLQLINAMDRRRRIRPFPKRLERLVLSLASQAAVAIANAQLTQQIKRAHYESILRLSVAAEYRDRDTYYHIQRMSRYSQIIARHLGVGREMEEMILYASPMHDVGKLGVPDAILLKPGPLTPPERAVMESHTLIGSEILGEPDSELIRVAKNVALTHHECYDGSGYPRGLRGDAIPLEGRIVALADVFDALSTRRVYKPSQSLDEVLAWIRRQQGRHFDPRCVDAFFQGWEEIQEVFRRFQEPPGSGSGASGNP